MEVGLPSLTFAGHYARNRRVLPLVSSLRSYLTWLSQHATSIEIREPTFFVLTVLASGQKPGYAIVQEVQALSGGHTVLRPGSLYTTLDRLAREGYIETAGEEVVAGRLRRYLWLGSRRQNVRSVYM